MAPMRKRFALGPRAYIGVEFDTPAASGLDPRPETSPKKIDFLKAVERFSLTSYTGVYALIKNAVNSGLHHRCRSPSKSLILLCLRYGT
jgi:hypothetical protein